MGRRAVALVGALALVVAACSGGDGSSSSPAATDDPGPPTPGGKVVYGVESDTGGGFCLPSAQLAISGVMVAQSIYDTLTWPNAEGEYVPYLAESVTPNDDFTRWTIGLRPGITYTDGSPLDAENVKLNLDSYRGENPHISSSLFSLALAPIEKVAVADPLTVVVTMSSPWSAFPAYLFSFGRMGMVSSAQLVDNETCADTLIGTGPFKLDGSWTPGTPVELVKNPDHWRRDAEGRQLPYLDEITFVSVVESGQRVTQLEAGQLDIMHTVSQPDLERLQGKADSGEVTLTMSGEGRETRYYMLNAGREPFDDPDARLAFALALDRDEINQLRNLGRATIADGPFDEGMPGHVADPGFPEHDLDRATELVEKVKADNGGRFRIEIVILPDTESRNEAELLKQQVEKAGITVDIRTVDQTAEISTAISGDYDVLLWRNHVGEDPDTQYVWWHSGEATNFGRIDDPEIDRLLEEGRATSDPAARAEAYEGVTEAFAENIWNVWAWYVDWGVATAPDVHGIQGPPLPDGSDPFPMLGGMHPTAGIWVSR